MKTFSKSIAFSFVLSILMTSLPSFGAVTSELNLQCAPRILVRYTPGPNWHLLEKILPRHMGFITGEMKVGHLESAGPLSTKADVGTGGISIYTLTDFRKVAEIVGKDPLILSEVSRFALEKYLQCKPAVQ